MGGVGHITLDVPGALVFTDAATGEPWFATTGALDREQFVIGEPIAVSDCDAYRHGPRAGGGAWDIDVPDGGDEITVLSTASGPADVHFTSSAPVQVFPDDDQDEPIHVGDVLVRTMQYTEWSDSFVIDLVAGERITVFVGAPSADMGLTVLGPGSGPPTGTSSTVPGSACSASTRRPRTRRRPPDATCCRWWATACRPPTGSRSPRAEGAAVRRCRRSRVRSRRGGPRGGEALERVVVPADVAEPVAFVLFEQRLDDAVDAAHERVR